MDAPIQLLVSPEPRPAICDVSPNDRRTLRRKAMGKMCCLVTGATGYVGARLVPRLVERGHDVRAMARSTGKLAEVPWGDSAEVVRGDLSDLDSLLHAFDGVDVVYYLVHSMGSSKDFAAEESRAVTNVVTAARRTRVRRLVYLSGLHPRRAKLSQHLQSRRAVGENLLNSDIETVVLQAGVIVGSVSASFEMIRHLTERLPAMTTPKWVHNKIQPIAISDVLHAWRKPRPPSCRQAGPGTSAVPTCSSTAT